MERIYHASAGEPRERFYVHRAGGMRDGDMGLGGVLDFPGQGGYLLVAYAEEDSIEAFPGKGFPLCKLRKSALYNLVRPAYEINGMADGREPFGESLPYTARPNDAQHHNPKVAV